MPDREKVIKGLYDLRRYLEDKEWSDKNAGTYFGTVTDALALLKEQEARLMTLDEIKEYSKVAYLDRDPIWIEIRDPDGGVSLFGSFHLIESYACEGEQDPIVRYWTARPTEEQRLAVKWDGTCNQDT